MAQNGFIRTKREIKFLILYVVGRLTLPAPLETVQEAVMCDGGVDFFEFSECLSSLVETEHVTRSADELYAVTQKGLENGRACENELPYSVRLAADALIAEANRKLQRRAQVRSSVTPRANGTFTAELILSDDGGFPLMRLELAAPRQETAKALTERFQKNPEQLYGELVELLFNEAKEEG